MSQPADFFAHNPYPFGRLEPIRDRREAEAECAFLRAAREVARACLLRDAPHWLAMPAFRELCALVGVDTDPSAEGARLPEIPTGWRRLEPHETLAAGDQWQPRRVRPSYDHDLRLPFEAIQPALHGTRASDSPVCAIFIRHALTSGA
jgi:hypothetical protein